MRLILMFCVNCCMCGTRAPLQILCCIVLLGLGLFLLAKQNQAISSGLVDKCLFQSVFYLSTCYFKQLSHETKRGAARPVQLGWKANLGAVGGDALYMPRHIALLVNFKIRRPHQRQFLWNSKKVLKNLVEPHDMESLIKIAARTSSSFCVISFISSQHCSYTVHLT